MEAAAKSEVIEEAPNVQLASKAMVIDDAFDDDIPDDEIKLEEFTIFYQESNQEAGAFDAMLKKHGLALPDLKGASDKSAPFIAFMHDLWKLRNSQEDTHEILNSLFHERLQSIDDLEIICDNLRQQGFEVVTKNSVTTDFNEVKEAGNHFKIILIDYNLGKVGDQAVANARNKAHEIYTACPEGKKPLMVLMSTFASVRNEVDAFRRDSNLGNIIFRFAPKENLTDQSTASLLVEIYKSETAHVHKLQKYVSTLHSAAIKAMKKFKDDIGSLTIDDYEFIHQTTADDQSHPLGDYLGWLYGAHWSNLLLIDSDLRKEKDELDKMLTDKPLPYHGMPSNTVVEIYMNALFEPESGEIPNMHSLAGKVVNDGKDKIGELPHLHLGDIFMQEGANELLMVLNPQCDLERPIDKMENQSILLIPGQLHPLDETAPNKVPKTELIIVEENRYRIIWKLKEVITIPLGKVNEWRRRQNFERKWRLRLPFALELQHEFTSMMSRVGLPVSPPFVKDINIQVHCKNIGIGMDILLKPSVQYGFLATWRKTDKRIRLTVDFAMDLKKSLLAKREDLVAVQQPELGEDGNPVPDPNANALVKQIDAFINEFDKWFLSTPYFDLPNTEGKNFIIKGLMKGILDYRPSEKDMKTLILIDVLSNKAMEQTAEASAEDTKAVAKDPNTITEKKNAAEAPEQSGG